MRQNSAISAVSLLAVFANIVLPNIAWLSSPVSAQTAAPVSLQEQLNAMYRVVKIGSDGDVTAPGTLLAVQKAGILALPWKSHIMCPSKFQDNALHLSTGLCAGMMTSYTGYI